MKLRETGSDNAKPKKNPKQLKAEEQTDKTDEQLHGIKNHKPNV
jgi:hypothetical protein